MHKHTYHKQSFKCSGQGAYLGPAAFVAYALTTKVVRLANHTFRSQIVTSKNLHAIADSFLLFRIIRRRPNDLNVP